MGFLPSQLILLFLVFIFQVVRLSKAQLPDFLYPVDSFCAGNPNLTRTAVANRDILLSSLSSNINSTGFYSYSVGDGLDRVNGHALCRGDVSLDVCRNCVRNATLKLVESCHNKNGAVGWYDLCMVRYSNFSISGVLATSPAFYMWNTANVTTSIDQFNQDLRTLLEGLRTQASEGGPLRKFAVGNRTAPDFRNLFGLVQCVPDLSAQDCSDCLTGAFGEIPQCCLNKIGGRVIRPSCNFRFEISRFYDEVPIIEAPSSSSPPPLAPPLLPPPPGKSNNTARTVIIIVVPVVAVAILLAAVSMCIFMRRRRKRAAKPEFETPDEISTVESLQIDFSTVKAATNNFSDANKLGHGGFGAVYEGKLSNGQEIAVKRLSNTSGQGEQEFKTEVSLLVRLQHRNLVRLLGFCFEGRERLLIYEFVPNSSLDKFIFDPDKRYHLDWDRRYKIIGGIARGLLYLHEDSRLRIIHRDLKASNVLLDEDMNPKISDFGTARLFASDETQGNTSRIAGTYGYMSPEYALYGQFSVKSDVFSFGVLLLEIVTGNRNSYFVNGESSAQDIPSYAWRNWREGTVANLIDPVLRSNSTTMQDITRCIHIGLLCVQENVEDRPTMASVVLMLSSSSLTLRVPSEPAFFLHSRIINPAISLLPEDDTKSSSSELSSHVSKSNKSTHSSSINNVSVTELHPR